ncbi:hypothetical protein [Pseudoalteromonas sp. S558]|jgi:hypothetical protein|uniref:hypothetical protein n=1 Tax=Pseudoalteromonas sp. S558 TaxID=2066515 RepID=UPI00110A5A14|nr:hypothetical protein [Pseudoalteromonas sp. S558]TMN94184.1 hypothetical protein CWB66_20470 [Pseudoalteromonas sp. S558]
MTRVLTHELALAENEKMIASFNYATPTPNEYQLPTDLVDEDNKGIIPNLLKRAVAAAEPSGDSDVNKITKAKAECMLLAQKASEARTKEILVEVKKYAEEHPKGNVGEYYSKLQAASDKKKQDALALCDTEYRNASSALINKTPPAKLGGVLGALSDAAGFLRGIVLQVIAWLKDLYNSILHLLQDIANFLEKAFEAVKNAFGNVFHSITGWF